MPMDLTISSFELHVQGFKIEVAHYITNLFPQRSLQFVRQIRK